MCFLHALSMSAQESVNDTEAGILSHTYTLDIPYDQIIALNEGYLDTATAVTERYQKDFGRWSDFWVSRVDENYEFSTYLNTMAELSNLPDPTAAPPNGQIAPPAVECCAVNGEWELEGPFYEDGTHQRSGIVFAVYSHPSQFPNTVYAGSGAGGLWKTTNGGDNWICLTDDLRMPGIGVPDIVGHPTDTNEILVATGFRRRAGKAYGFGVLKSTNGGDDFTMPLSWDPAFGQVVYDLEIDPKNSQIVYAAANRAIHRSTDFGDTWNIVDETQDIVDEIQDTDPNNTNGSSAWDYVEVKVVDDETGAGYGAVFSLAEPHADDNSTSLVIRYSETGADNSFNNLPLPADDPSNPCKINLDGKRAYLATSAAAPNTLFVLFHSTCDNIFIAYKLVKDDSTGNWEWEFLRNLDMVSQNVGSPSKSFPAFEVSQVNPTIFYVGGVHIKRFDVLITNYTNLTPTDDFGDYLNGTVHDDTRAIQVVASSPDGADDHLLIGTDGGISYTMTGLIQSNSNNWTNMNGHEIITTDQTTGMVVNELCITEFFDMDVAPNSQRSLFGGAQDNGTMDAGLIGPDPTVRTTWGHIDGGDGGASLFDWANPNRYFWRANQYLRYSGGGSEVIRQCEPGDLTSGCNKSCDGVMPSVESLKKFDNFKLRQHPFDGEKIYVKKGWLFQSLNRNTSPSSITRNFYREFSRCEGKIATFELSPSQPDIIYLSKNDDNKRLYRSDNGGQNWDRIDDNIVRNTNNGQESGFAANYVTRTILIDPLNPDKLWCELNSFFPGDINAQCDNGMRRIVELVRQPDEITYLETDISNGLPPLPINTLIREDMSGVMYAGTDVGVYRYDPNTASPTWECFNMGLPPAIVLDLEINHCENRIYAATHGRGIFSSALPTSPEILVTTDQTWAAGPAMYAHNNIIVSNGATLTINTTLFMSPDTRIEVEPGSQLRVIGGTITAACDNTWQGIYVEGNANLPQNTSNQGRVQLVNATIEHAHDAISTRAYSPSWYADGTMGGMIEATNTQFLNNKRDIQMLRYKNTNASGVINNISYFRLCTLSIDDQYRFPTIKPNVTMWAVNGINFKGCTFEDARTEESPGLPIDADNPSEKVGIQSLHTAYTVNEDCGNVISFPPPFSCTGGVPARFINLGYGISSSSLKSYGITVRNAEFDTWHGIHAHSISTLAIEGNNFNVKRQNIPQLPNGDPDWNVVPSYGVHLDKCRGYIVQNNDLTSEYQLGSPTSGDETAGIVVRNNHSGGEQIYRNDFTNFNVGCEAIAQNKDAITNPTLSLGLEFICNEFTDGRVDIFVSPEVNPYLTATTINGIKPIQNLPANLFTLDDPTDPNYALARHIINLPGAVSMTYNHHAPATEARVEPTLVSNGVNVNNSGVTLNINATCPDLLSTNDGLGIDDGIIILGGIKDVKNNLIQTTLGTLQTLTDNGNTPLLVAAVNAPQPRRSFRAYVNIMQQAPFTSDEVLEIVSKKETGWTKGMIRNVLRTHSQAAKSATIQENLDNRINQLPLFMRNQINQGMTIISEKERMELDVNTYKRERNLAINQAVQLLASDTIDRTTDMIDFLANTEDIQYEYRLSEACDVLGDTEQANAALTNIGNMELTESEIQAHTDYKSFRQLMQTWEFENKNLTALSEGDIETLEGYTEHANITAGDANALLQLNGIDTYKEPVYFPDEVETELRIIQYTEEEVSEDRLLIYPNPAKDYVIIEYAVKELDNTDLFITITDLSGRQVYEEKLSYQQDELVIIAQQFPQGQYFCTLRTGSNIIKTDKFILAK